MARKGMLTKINDHFFPDNQDIDQAYVYLRGPITIETCSEVIETILAINVPETDVDEDGNEFDVDKPDVINLLITSVGGDMNAAFALIAVMKGSTVPIRTIVVGEASSAAFCIFMAGDQRVITPYASLMSHSFSTSVEGHYHDLKNAMIEMNSYNSKMIELYHELTGLDRKIIKNKFLSHTDAYIPHEDAIKYNMADLLSDLK